MPYLNLDLNYFDNPKTLRLIGLLGKGSEVLPIKLWCYCGKHHTESGRLVGYSTEEIESVLGWWGESGKMVEAMVKVQFLEIKDDEYFLHDWLEHEGHLAAFKKRAKQAARKRWGKLRSNTISNAKNNIKQYPNQTIPNQPNQPNLPNHTIPNQTRPVKMGPPSLEEVIDYCKERKNQIDPQYFFDKNNSIGWVDKNGRPYKDWKSVIRTWEKFDNERKSAGKTTGKNFEYGSEGDRRAQLESIPAIELGG